MLPMCFLVSLALGRAVGNDKLQPTWFVQTMAFFMTKSGPHAKFKKCKWVPGRAVNYSNGLTILGCHEQIEKQGFENAPGQDFNIQL